MFNVSLLVEGVVITKTTRRQIVSEITLEERVEDWLQS
jgi:hypothetical protein